MESMTLDRSSNASIDAKTSGAIFFVNLIKSWNLAFTKRVRFSPSFWSILGSIIRLALTLEKSLSDSKDSIWALCAPSTKTFTVPSGSLISCKIFATVATLNKSSNDGASIDPSFWAARIIFFSPAIAAFNALIDLFLPTKRVETTPGKITTSLRGIKGRSYLIVAI